MLLNSSSSYVIIGKIIDHKQRNMPPLQSKITKNYDYKRYHNCNVAITMTIMICNLKLYLQYISNFLLINRTIVSRTLIVYNW